MDMLYGAVGALLVVVLLAAGAWVGWTAHKKFYHVSPEKLADDELKKMQAAQDAFRQMQGYNADIAYGIGAEAETELGGEQA